MQSRQRVEVETNSNIICFHTISWIPERKLRSAQFLK